MMGSDSDETQVFKPPPLSILQRLDRLELLVQFLEEKHCFCLSSAMKVGDEGKSLCSALEEAQHKGTIMERVTQLENRLIQKSMVAVARGCSLNSASCTRQRKSLWRMRYYRNWLKCLQLGCSCSRNAS